MGNKKRNAFAGCSIATTGRLRNYTRNEINAVIAGLGAKAAGNVTKNTDYLICGENPGSKLEKARELGTAILTEQEFLDMASA